MNMLIPQDLKEYQAKASNDIRDANYKSALLNSHEILSRSVSLPAIFAAAGIMIDAGYGLADESAIHDGIRLLEDKFDAFISEKKLAPSTCYYLANGYSAIAGLKMRADREFALFSDTELSNAKFLYLWALKIAPDNNRPTILVNLGNCFDHLGRSLDALECYEKAIRIDRNHAMATGNKGICLSSYSSFTEHSGTFLREAHSLIKRALQLGVNSSAAAQFESTLAKIEGRFKDKSVLDTEQHYPGITIDSNSNIESSLMKFCLNERLYLNICNYCQKCDGAVGDPVAIKRMIVPLKKQKSGVEALEEDPYLKLSGYVNQIKQAYVSARFLLFLSQYEDIDLSFVDKRVRVIDTLDYSVNNIRIELLKKSFKSFYDVLDMIAAVINEYLGLGIKPKHVTFSRFWYEKKSKYIRSDVMETKNFALNAIFDIRRDLESGYQQRLKHTRHALTHRFIHITMFEDTDDESRLSSKQLVAQTLDLARIVRNAALYLLRFIEIEENKKEANSTGFMPPLFAIDIPDHLK